MTMTNEQMADLANEAGNVAIAYIQEKLGIPTGDFAGLYFSGGDDWIGMTSVLLDYIDAEIKMGEI